MAKDKLKDRDDPGEARPAGQRGTAGNQGTASQTTAAPTASASRSTTGQATGDASASAADAAGGQHHEATAHGRPARIDRSLPADREALVALHREARRRRAAAALGSEAYRAAVDEVGRIEVRIADVDRAADPPRG